MSWRRWWPKFPFFKRFISTILKYKKKHLLLSTTEIRLDHHVIQFFIAAVHYIEFELSESAKKWKPVNLIIGGELTIGNR